MKNFLNGIDCSSHNNFCQEELKYDFNSTKFRRENLITPRYEFSRGIILENYSSICDLLPFAEIHYFLKANASPLVLKVLCNTECKFEISGRREYKRLRYLGVDNSRIICGLPVKPRELICDLYQAGIRYFVFDNHLELEKLEQLAPTAKKIMRLYIKDLINDSIEYGAQISDIINNFEIIRKCDGLSFHISENYSIDSIKLVIDRVESILKMIEPIKNEFILNLGGGWRLGDEYELFYKYLKHRMESLQRLYPLKIYAEPGSAIVKTAGNVITKVISIKINTSFVDVFVDAGSPIGVVRTPDFVINSRNEMMNGKLYYRFIEITNMHRTLFIKKLPFSIKEDDILTFGGYGAYSIAYRTDFHLWDNPYEIIIE